MLTNACQSRTDAQEKGTLLNNKIKSIALAAVLALTIGGASSISADAATKKPAAKTVSKKDAKKSSKKSSKNLPKNLPKNQQLNLSHHNLQIQYQ